MICQVQYRQKAPVYIHLSLLASQAVSKSVMFFFLFFALFSYFLSNSDGDGNSDNNDGDCMIHSFRIYNNKMLVHRA